MFDSLPAKILKRGASAYTFCHILERIFIAVARELPEIGNGPEVGEDDTTAGSPHCCNGIRLSTDD